VRTAPALLKENASPATLRPDPRTIARREETL
jgi:hypothetical protein